MALSQFCEGCAVPIKHKCLIHVSCYISEITSQLPKYKKDFQTYLIRFNQAVPLKLNHVKVKLFYHQMDNQDKIFYILEYKKLTGNAHLEIKTH